MKKILILFIIFYVGVTEAQSNSADSLQTSSLQVNSGIENVVAFKKKHKSKTPFIMLQFIVFKHNEHEIEQIKSIGKELGIDKVVIKTAQIYDYENKRFSTPKSLFSCSI